MGGCPPRKQKFWEKMAFLRKMLIFFNAKKLDFCINALEPLSDFHKSAENFLKIFFISG